MPNAIVRIARLPESRPGDRLKRFAPGSPAEIKQYIHCGYMRTSTQIARWGNSLGLRLSKSVAAEARIGEGDTVEVWVKDGTIIVRPAQSPYSLHELVSKITPRNRRGETDWGKPTGHELW